jgi:hypothetical protein
MKPRFVKSAIQFSLGVLATGILTACGGAGGSGSIDVADGGIRGTGSSVGPVSGFGSVIVNGVRFDTDGITNRIVDSNDGIENENDLDEGMILRVDGEWLENGEGTAESVEYDDTLRGPIMVVTAWNPGAQTAVISILGLEVLIDRQTVVKGVVLPDELTDGDVVRVSGWRLADGSFRASLVRVHSGTANSTAFDVDNDIELEGRIENLNLSPCSFELGTVSVDCGSLDIESPLNASDLREGAFFEIEGNLNTAGTEVLAAEIRPDDQRRYRRSTEDDIEFAGPVTEDFEPATNSFSINGITVNITPETEFDDDLMAEDLVSGLLVQVEGDYLNDGTVNAEEIELREANAQVQGPIDDVFRDDGAFTVGGVRVQVTPLTLIEDDDEESRLNQETFFQKQLMGAEVEVEGVERGSGNNIFIEALKIEIENQETEDGTASFELEGKLREIEDNSLSILGVTMTYSADAVDDRTRIELQGLIKPSQNQYPLVEIEYEALSPGAFQFRANDIERE